MKAYGVSSRMGMGQKREPSGAFFNSRFLVIFLTLWHWLFDSLVLCLIVVVGSNFIDIVSLFMCLTALLIPW
jgi:hypothetical protein